MERAKGRNEKNRKKKKRGKENKKKHQVSDMTQRGGKEGTATREELCEAGGKATALGRERLWAPRATEGEKEGAGGRASGCARPRCRRRGASGPAELRAPGQPPSGWGVPGSNPIGVAASPCRAAGQLQARLAHGEGRKERE